MKLGARMFKTGLAVAIALYCASLIGFPSTVFAGFAAVFAIQPSIYQSFKITIKQLHANFVGVTTGIVLSYLLGNEAIVVGISVVIVIILCRFFKLEKSAVSIALIAVISVMETTMMEIYQFGLLRFSSLMLGILSAFVVNLVFIPPKYESTLFQHIEHLTLEILQWLRVTTRHLSDDPSLKKEMKRINGELRRMDELYLLFSEERVYLQKNRLMRARKLVLFRQLIKVSHASFDLLKTIQTLDNRTNMIPKDIQTKLVQEIDLVIHRHEHMLLSFIGKIKRYDQSIAKSEKISEFIDALLNLYQENESDYLIFLPLATKLMTYYRELSHLQSLLNSYDHFHSDEKFKIIPKRDLD
ncbi:FUSC family protein [Amphibacillus sp. Q70]|uniref:FUSC family protein n=1 Tax=Amphibacillus sp. Q70 TaxID=3453416 RepID=UPI003F862573